MLLTERSRRRLALVLSIWHGALSLAAIGLIYIGIDIKVTLENYSMILEGHYGGALPNMLIAVGSLQLIVHGAGVKLSIWCITLVSKEANTYGFTALLLSDSPDATIYRGNFLHVLRPSHPHPGRFHKRTDAVDENVQRYPQRQSTG